MIRHIILKYLCVTCLLFFSGTILAQEYPTGLNFDDAAYEREDLKATLLSRDYTVLPSSASLKQYCPNPGLQKGGTCVGWSTAWAARTILEAKQNGWTDKNVITDNTFSSYFVYTNIKDPNDYTCARGSYIENAMKLMINKGVPKYKDFSEPCSPSIPVEVYKKGEPFKIQSYARLFEGNASNAFIIQSTKKALSNGNPVVIGMKCPDSFNYAKGYWQPTEDFNGKFGGHAMCVIGYNDAQYGGAFEVMNSWGSNWGNQGFIWIKYDDFANFTKYGYEAIAIPKSSPQIKTTDLAGEIRFQLSSGQEMKATFVKQQGNLGYYKVNEAYISGTKFRLYISNNEPAYVYAIGSDLKTGNLFTVFPHKPNISAALNYKSNNVALPDEEHYIRMDNTTGKDYLCVLYSKEPLNIESIKSQIKQQTGSFADKVNAVLKSKLVSSQDIQYTPGNIKFSASSKGKTLVALIVETDHN